MKIHYLFLALLFSGLLSAAGKVLAIIREDIREEPHNTGGADTDEKSVK